MPKKVLRQDQDDGGGTGRGWRRGVTDAFDAGRMGAFVSALERGATVTAAAREAGVAVSTLYHRRRTSPVFAEAWAEAAARSARRVLVSSTRGRKLVLKKARPQAFGRERKQLFLNLFPASCNIEATAREAGVGVTTVYRHLNSDPAFAAGFQEALELGYRLLEAEAVAQMRAAQEAYRIDPAAPGAAQSFERTLQLLREYKRGHGQVGRRPNDKRLTRWSFGEAMAALEKKLEAMGVEIDEEAEPERPDDGMEA